MASILVVDDEKKITVLLARSLEKRGHTVHAAGDGQEALERLRDVDVDMIFTDQRMSPMGGLELLDKVREADPTMRVVMMTGHGEVSSAVQAMKAGAYDYLTKPLDLEEVVLLAERIAGERALQEENLRWREMVGRQLEGWDLLGQSPAMRKVQELLIKVAPTNATVLIRGESGTGKELTAKAIHKHSVRAQKPFVAVNCAAIPDSLLESELFGYVKGAFTGADNDKAGLFKMAHTGTIFLDEVGEANSSVQAKLLRALEERKFIPVGGHKEIEVDVRILAATNRDLERLISEGHFREDLYYRFNVFPVDLPPLRDRLDDLPLLIPHFLQELGRDLDAIDAGVPSRLRGYPWPGNVRELRNILERAHILAGPDRIGLEHVMLPELAGGEAEEGMGGREPLNLNIEEHERRLIKLALRRSGGNKTRAAEMVGLTRRALYSRMERLGIPIEGS